MNEIHNYAISLNFFASLALGIYLHSSSWAGSFLSTEIDSWQ